MESILWWQWIVLGIVLVLMEIVVPSFTIFWFGLGALLTGLLLALLPSMSLKWQVLVFSLSSTGFTFLWFWYFVPRRKKTSGQADEQLAIGQTGIAATRATIPGDQGRVVFSVPVLDEEAWPYQADEPIETGNRLRVVEVITTDEGDRLLKVKKVT